MNKEQFEAMMPPIVEGNHQTVFLQTLCDAGARGHKSVALQYIDAVRAAD